MFYSLQLVPRYPQVFACRHYLLQKCNTFWRSNPKENFEPQGTDKIFSKARSPSKFSNQMEAMFFMIIQIFFCLVQNKALHVFLSYLVGYYIEMISQFDIRFVAAWFFRHTSIYMNHLECGHSQRTFFVFLPAFRQDRERIERENHI